MLAQRDVIPGFHLRVFVVRVCDSIGLDFVNFERPWHPLVRASRQREERVMFHNTNMTEDSQ